MNTYKMAACGVNCNECNQYKVTVNNDVEAAEAMVGWFRSQGWIGEDEGSEAVMRKAPLCKGCWDIADDCFWKCGCGSVDFRVCCKEKQINHCGECDDFPCKDYEEWASWHEGHKIAMEYLLSLRSNT